MTNSFFKILSAALLLLVIFLVYRNCENSKSCTETSSAIDNQDKEDLDLKFDCTDEIHFQPLHLDLVNDFGILGRITMADSGTVKMLNIKLKEVGSCKQYSLDSVKYLGSRFFPSNKSLKIHDLQVEINKSFSGERKIYGEITDNFKIQENDRFDIHIKSDNIGIPQARISIDPVTGGIIIIPDPTTYFGNNICTTRVIL